MAKAAIAPRRKHTPTWSEHAAEWRDRVVILAETWQRALAAEGSERAAMLAWASRVSRAARGLASERETHLVLTLAARGDRTNADFPQRIQLSRAKGWRLPEGAVSVARPTKWGNPWTVAGARAAGYKGSDADLRAVCVEMFRRGEAGGLPALNGMQDRIPELRGKSLACWCPLPAAGEPDHCHAAVLLERANAPLRCEATHG